MLSLRIYHIPHLSGLRVRVSVNNGGNSVSCPVTLWYTTRFGINTENPPAEEEPLLPHQFKLLIPKCMSVTYIYLFSDEILTFVHRGFNLQRLLASCTAWLKFPISMCSSARWHSSLPKGGATQHKERRHKSAQWISLQEMDSFSRPCRSRATM